jgi:Poxvirus A22 protein
MFVLSIDIGIKNLAHCLFHVDHGIKIVAWDVVNLTNEYVCKTCLKKAKYEDDDDFYCNKHKTIQSTEICYKNSKEYTMIDLGITLNDKYNMIFKDQPIDVILIENQIGPLANRMKTLQGMIIQYWIMKQVKNIHCISSSNKLKLFVKGKTSYKDRKSKSIEITKTLMIPEWLDHFNSHKKKDDLADTYLQGIWYFYQNKIINAEYLKLNVLNKS